MLQVAWLITFLVISCQHHLDRACQKKHTQLSVGQIGKMTSNGVLEPFI